MTGPKVPPNSSVAEQSVLGALLMDRDAVIAVVEFLRPEHFYDEKNKRIYQAIIDLYQEREPVDVVTVNERLKKDKSEEIVGGSTYLASLVEKVPTAAHAEHYAHLIQDAFTKRRLISAASKITDLAFDEAGEVKQILDMAEQSVFSLAQQHLKQVFVPVKEILAESFDRLDELHKSAGTLRGVPTGFSDLDDTLAGMQNSNLIILAARPGTGKCVTGDTLIIDPETGLRTTIENLVSTKGGKVMAMNSQLKLENARPSAFVDDGVKPVFEIKTFLGNRIEATAVHPLFTIMGWKRVEELKTGDRIGVPRSLNCFGNRKWEEWRVKSLAYFLGDGGVTGVTPKFTNSNPILMTDFSGAVREFGNIEIVYEKQSELRMRTPSVKVVNKDQYQVSLRGVFATKLNNWLEKVCWSQRKLAQSLGVSPALVCMWASGSTLPGLTTHKRLEDLWGEPVEKVDRINPLTRWLSDLGVMGKLAVEKEIPSEVFGLSRDNISLMLNRLYACEGSVIFRKGRGTGSISFASSSGKLAEQVKHLLLRFGILARLREKRVKYRNEYRKAYEVEITGTPGILTFAKEIGIFGKEAKLAKLERLAQTKGTTKNFSKDTLPIEIWKMILEDKGKLSWREVYARMGRPPSYNIHVNRRELRRETLRELAEALDSDRLRRFSDSHLYWDRVVSITSMGQKHVYDLTVDKLHNFVAGDIVVHNTALALNIAANAAFGHKMPVGFFSLEMSREELMDRLLVAQAEIDAWKLKTGNLSEDEFSKLSDAMGELYETPLYIDDTPGMSILEMRTKARRLQAEHGLKLVIVDYLQLARASRSHDSRVQEVSEISQGLKNLARELKVPVMALSQLSRQVEQRGIKKPQLADLRESGAIEQDADVVMFLWRDNEEDLENIKLDIAKHRNGPLRSINMRFKGDRLKFYGIDRVRKVS